jgi:hypothetical protein
MVNVTSKLIGRGRFLQDLDAEILRMSRKVTEHYEEYGDKDTAHGKITVEIEFAKSKTYDQEFELNYSIKPVVPKPPKCYTRVKQHGLNLMVDSNGSGEFNPAQASLDVFEPGSDDPVNDEPITREGDNE